MAHKAEEVILTVSQALRTLPEKGDHTEIKKIKGMISSIRPVFTMIAGEFGSCKYCNAFYNKDYEKPRFNIPANTFLRYCEDYENLDHPLAYDENGKPVYDNNGFHLRSRVKLDIEFEYRNALIIELQDEDNYDDLERLQVILFDNNTLDVQAGELVTVTGQIYIEKLTSSRDSKLSSRMYSHSINYEARKEISISNVDIDAIHSFVDRFGVSTLDQLVKMFAPQVIGYEHVKKGLLLSAASCSNDFQSNRTNTKKPRVRINSLLVGDPGTAKSILVREATKIVPNSRFESAQNSSGKSLTAIVSKEGEDTTILRLGPIPLAKEAICGLNELGRMSFEEQAPLLDVMEEGEFSINKYHMHARIRSPTVIIASANQTTSRWSDLNNDGKISLDDIPAIRPLLDRFDFLFIFRTSRDPAAIRDFTYKKSGFEDKIIPDYNVFLTKYLKYTKRFEPKISVEAETVLNEYYIGIAKLVGSPRIRDTLYRTARMISRLKLKNMVDGEDAQETCQFYNVILGEHDQVVNIPANPRDITLNECLYMLEATQVPIAFEELIKKVCNKDEYIKTYVGKNLKIRDNVKLRTILEMLLQNSHVKRVSMKPTVLQWVSSKPKEKKKEPSSTNSNLCDRCDPCDSDNITFTTENIIASRTVALAKVSSKNVDTKAVGSHISRVSQTDSNFDLVDPNVLEIPMGLNKDWSIKRIGEKGDTWSCDYPGCSDNNSGNVVTGSVGAIKGHALNHELAEIQDELQRLSDLDLGSLLEELKKCSKDTLQIFQNHVEHGSALEHYILEALDKLEERIQ